MTYVVNNKYTPPNTIAEPLLPYLRAVNSWLGFCDNNAAGSHQFAFMTHGYPASAGAGQNLFLYISPDNSGTSYAAISLRNSGSYVYQALSCFQGADGKVHTLYYDNGVMTYERFALTYTGTSITGVTSETQFTVYTPTTYADSKGAICEVTANDNSKRVFLCVTDSTGGTATFFVAATWSTTATASSAVTKLDGTAGTTTLTARATINPHGYGANATQVPSSKAILFSMGDMPAEGPYYGASYYWLTPTGTVAWTVGARTDESNTPPVNICGCYATADHIYRCTYDTSNFRFQSFNDSGSRTDNAFPAYALSDVASCAQISLTDDASVMFMVVATWSGYHRAGYCSGGTWSVTALTAFTDQYGQSGIAGDWGVVSIVSDLVGGDNNPCVSSVIDDTAFTQIGGTLSYTATGGAVVGGSAQARGHVPGISWESVGSIAYSAANGTSVAPGFPAGLVAGNPYSDALVMFVHQKPSTANSGTVTTPSGWTLLGSLTQAGGYGTSLAADTGNTNLFVYTKDTVTGSESGTQSVTVGTNSVSAAQIHRISKQGTGAWQFALATGQRTSSPNGTVAVQATTDPGLTANDLVISYFGIPTDVTTPSQFTSESFSATGVTAWAGFAEVNEPDSGNGNDIGGVVCQARVATGTSSAAPYFNATAGGTTTNVRGPLAIFRAREATVATYSYTGDGGGLVGGTATEARTVLQSVAGGALAGGAATLKRTVVALVAGGAIAGGAAGVTTATGSIQTVTHVATGGAIAGGAATAKQAAKASGVGGALAGGTATEKRTAARATSGGGVVGGAATATQVAKTSATGGGVVGGAAHEARTVVAKASGGAVVGGAAQTVQPPRYTAQGGAIGGGAAYEKRAVGVSISGGAIAGGTATERRTLVLRPSTGAVGGGAATIRRTNALTAQGGAVAGGAATEKRVYAYLATGGGIVGGVTTRLQKAVIIGAGGGVAGGYATWSSSAPIDYYYGAEGGAVAGGSARVAQTVTARTVGGSVAGGAARSSVTAQRYVSGGAIAGGAAVEHRAVKWIGVGGSVAGGASPTTRLGNVLPVGGAIAGGAAVVKWIGVGGSVARYDRRYVVTVKPLNRYEVKL